MSRLVSHQHVGEEEEACEDEAGGRLCGLVQGALKTLRLRAQKGALVASEDATCINRIVILMKSRREVLVVGSIITFFRLPIQQISRIMFKT